jgi:hypothetical protein
MGKTPGVVLVAAARFSQQIIDSARLIVIRKTGDKKIPPQNPIHPVMFRADNKHVRTKTERR